MLIFQSCSYLLKTAETIDGEKVFVRYYPNYEKRQDYQIRCAFKYQYKEESHKKYAGSILSDTIQDMIYFQFDTVRTYLSGDAVKFQNIFSEGLLYNQMIYCVNDSLCRIPKEREFINIETGKPTLIDFYGWTGPKLLISDFKELNYGTSKTVKRFRFNISYSNGFSVYVLELQNSNKPTNLDIFIEGAKVTFLEYGWTEI